MTTRTNWREIRRDLGPEREARIRAELQGIRDAVALAALRQSRNMSQTNLAEALEVSQARVSRIEREPDIYLSTLRRYVEALGGELELRVVFRDGESVDEVVPLAVGGDRDGEKVA